MSLFRLSKVVKKPQITAGHGGHSYTTSGDTTKGSAIRLYEATDRVAVAEGVETALAVRSARHIPVWSTVNALGMATLILPDSIKSVEIWADHDRNETGQDAARELAQRLHRSGVQVRLFIPEAPGDWLDVLNAEEVAA